MSRLACGVPLRSVHALSLTFDERAKVYRLVDYRNLGPEGLGSIYGSLLELHPQINVQAERFALATAGGNERKTTGLYYTPTSLIDALLDSALDPVIAAAIAPAPTANPSASASGREEQETVHLASGGERREVVREMASKAMRDIARDLRQRQTPAEQILWEALRNNRLGVLGFRRQHPVANTSYVADFFCYSAN